jgi:hypothetical protein
MGPFFIGKWRANGVPACFSDSISRWSEIRYDFNELLFTERLDMVTDVWEVRGLYGSSLGQRPGSERAAEVALRSFCVSFLALATCRLLRGGEAHTKSQQNWVRLWTDCSHLLSRIKGKSAAT